MNKKNLVVTILVLLCIIGTDRLLMSQEMVITQKDGSVQTMPVNEIDDIKFRLTGTVTDYEGNVYKTVKIGNQWWMAENLRATQFNNGKSIDKVTDATAWENLDVTETPAYCAHGNDDSNVPTYGYLYNWYAASTAELAPTGWHLPTDNEWKELEMTLGMAESEVELVNWRGTNEGSKLAGRTDLWLDGALENNVAFGSSGFSALPAGYRADYSIFYNKEGGANFWSASELTPSSVFYRGLFYTASNCYRGLHKKTTGMSVRFVRD